MPDLDERYVVFGCLSSNESYTTLDRISHYATPSGAPVEDLIISDCGISYPDPEVAKAKLARAQEKAAESLKKSSRFANKVSEAKDDIKENT